MPGSRSDRPARRGAALRGDASWRSFGYRHSDRKSTRLNSSHLVISYAVFCLKKKNVVDRKSTRLNSSHLVISYAVFCLKKKNNKLQRIQRTSITSGPGAYTLMWIAQGFTRVA